VLSNESVRLWLRHGDRVVLVESRESAQPVRFVSPPPGASLPLHAAASGKAILARLPPRELEEFLARPLATVAARTITDPARLREDLAAVRSRGYATTFHEAGDDIGGVGAAITDPAGIAVAALSVALPVHRVTDAIVVSYGRAAATEAHRVSAELAGPVSD
jgi:IclR family acetate operon transcriptional repressor